MTIFLNNIPLLLVT